MKCAAGCPCDLCYDDYREMFFCPDCGRWYRMDWKNGEDILVESTTTPRVGCVDCEV